MSGFHKITESGLSFANSKSDRRNVVLTNYISLLVSATTILLLVGRFFFAKVNFSIVISLVEGSVFLLLPILLNRFGFITISRLALCWLPPIYQFYAIALAFDEIQQRETSYYVGLRFMLLAYSCFPFLVFDIRKKGPFILGLLGPLSAILLFDPILNLFGLGYYQIGLHEVSYSFNNVRMVVSFLLIGASSYFLKKLVEENEEVNDRLVQELAEKNALLQQQAENEVIQLNQQLQTNLLQLTEREFILNQSQRIAKIGSWEYRIKDSFIFWSDEMYNIFGLEPGFDLKTRNLPELMLGEDGEILINATIALLRTGEPYDLTLRARNPFGYLKWVRLNAFPIVEDGQVLGVRGICHDITFYKEAEELLRSSEYKYRSLFEQATDFILLVDFDGNLVEVNHSLCKAFGYTREELMKLKIEDLIDPEQLRDRPILYAELDRGEHVLSQRRMKYKNGSIVDVEANVKKLQEGIMLVMARDVTKLREVQRQIELSEARFRGAFEFSAIGMALVSLDGKWLKVNKELCQIVGYTEAELLALRFQDITHPEDIASDLRGLEQALAGEIETYRMEKRYVHKDSHFVWVNLSVSLIKDNNKSPLFFVSQVEEITERKKAEEEKDKARYLLNERVKELTTLYHASQIMQTEQNTVEEVLQQIASILPPGWQYPEISAARIVLGEVEYKTSNFKSTLYRQRSEFRTDQGPAGLVEVVYLEQKPSEVEGPFLAEERHLIDMIAEMLRIYLNRRRGEEALKKSEANLNATINNTEILIWSVDPQFRLITYNKPFYDYIKLRYGAEIQPGFSVLGSNPTDDNVQVGKSWQKNYLRALSGEIVVLEESRFGIDIQYSLSPIIEGDQIIGVTVFANNVTEKNARDRELAEANKKVGELKLMALRSVMSPHFIFNVLNSIQYFIARNDRLNAINYLSTFSKLIRSILTHSVNNKIKLTEEIDMLTNYIQLEMTRFENKFDFTMRVDEGVDVDGIEIPSLLIQPYVENAILHGLYNKKTKGSLAIRIREEDDTIVFEIEDNGIGREAALKIRQQHFPAHKSMGIKLTEERLKLINQQHKAVFQIEDLHDENGPSGTRVRIRVVI